MNAAMSIVDKYENTNVKGIDAVGYIIKYRPYFLPIILHKI